MHREDDDRQPLHQPGRVARRGRALLRRAQAAWLLAAMGWSAGCTGLAPVPVTGTLVADMPSPPLRAAAMEGSGSRYGPTGRYKVLHSPCRQDGAIGRPVVLPDRDAQPAVGRPTRVQWNTELLAPKSPASAFLLVSFGVRPPVNLTAAGFPGCLMHVDPNPANLWTLAPAPGSLLTLDGGRLMLHWTPGPEFIGQELVLQPLFALPPRWMWAPAVQVWVGG